MSAKPLVQPSSKLYDEDFVRWTAETARLLRDGRFADIDVEHVAEEIEDMGNRDHRELFSRLTLIIQHLLKWEYQPDKRSRSWRATIAAQQAKIDRLILQSPSLRRTVPELVPEVYRDAVRQASIETDLPEDSFPRECPFTPEQILDRDFLPGR
jgi:hypothetical protein